MRRALREPEGTIKEVIGDFRPHIVRKKWGYERSIVNHELYCGKILTVVPNGMACSLHYHPVKHETFHILRGTLLLQTLEEGERKARGFVLFPGSTIALPPRTAHRFWTEREVCDFVEISTTDNPEDSVRLVESGPAPENLAFLEKRAVSPAAKRRR